MNDNMWISINISLNFVAVGQIKINTSLVQILAWCRSGDKPLSEPMMVSLMTLICVSRPQWFKEEKDHTWCANQRYLSLHTQRGSCPQTVWNILVELVVLGHTSVSYCRFDNILSYLITNSLLFKKNNEITWSPCGGATSHYLKQ